MTHREPARPITRHLSSILVASLMIVIAAVSVDAGHKLLATSSLPPASGRPIDTPRSDLRGGIGVADGIVPENTTVFDNEIPAVARLEPGLLSALRRAAADAAAEGVAVYVSSGWRSAAYQEELLEGAVWKYGSEEEAARWVATANTSAHVSGNAVDIGPLDAMRWLSQHGADYGLCQIYSNEPWHYELRLEAINHGCPQMYIDPTHDPEMQP